MGVSLLAIAARWRGAPEQAERLEVGLNRGLRREIGVGFIVSAGVAMVMIGTFHVFQGLVALFK